MDILNKEHMPALQELIEYIDNPLFETFYEMMEKTYHPIIKMEYSRDVWEPGWNLKMKKAGRSLCTLYPREGYFKLLIVVGSLQKPYVEEIFSQLSSQMQILYQNTKEGNNQRWLMVELHHANALYQDCLRLIDIRKHS